jgi:hypothetical protein
MKQKLLILIALAFSTFAANAQILNSGFENWSTTEPSSWVTTNGLMILGNTQSVFKTIDAHSDSFACEMRSTIVTNKPPGVFVPDYVGSIFIGKQIGIQSIRGMKYNNKPSNFEFWYKYSSTTGDTATGLIMLTKFNPTLSKTDTIAIGFFMNSANASSYTKATVNLTYLSAASPDTAVVVFSAITPFSKNAGSIFKIDDMAFTGGNVGMNEQNNNIDFTLFPNPSNGESIISFSNVQSEINLGIYDLQGKEILNNTYHHQSKIVVLTNQLHSGVYLIKVANASGTSFKKLIVE